MEPRKIQKVGYSTLSVSLPMNWAKKTGIKKGDVVFISEENDGAYKNVDDVVEVSHQLGIGTKVVKLKPLGVTKG